MRNFSFLRILGGKFYGGGCFLEALTTGDNCVGNDTVQ